MLKNGNRSSSVSLLIFATLFFARIDFSQAQYELTFSGYVMDVPVGQRINSTVARFLQADREQFLNVTRIRLRPTVVLWDNAQLSLEYEVTSLYHSTSMFFPLQGEKNNRQVWDLTWNPVHESRFSVLHFIDRLYWKQSFGFGDVVVGRQRIAWGTGRIWNPTDLFNPLNPTSFAKIEKDGVDALQMKFHLGSFTDLALVVNPQNGWHTSNVGFRFRTNVNEYDFSLVGGYFNDRIVAGTDFAGNLFDAGVRGEGIVSVAPTHPDSNFAKFIVGVDYQFTSKLYALLEYHFNGEGTTDKMSYELARLIEGDILNLGRQYVTISGSYLIHPLVTLMLSLTSNMVDGSQFIGASISFSVEENVMLAVGGQLFRGDDFTEYWYYPNALYLKADIYF